MQTKKQKISAVIVFLVILTAIYILVHNNKKEWVTYSSNDMLKETPAKNNNSTVAGVKVENNSNLENGAVRFPETEKEIYFDTPKPIEWIGEVVTHMVSGQAYAMRMIGGDFNFDYFYADPFETGDGKFQFERGTKLKIKGDLLGITCAYQFSIFRGACVPDVEVISVSIVD